MKKTIEVNACDKCEREGNDVHKCVYCKGEFCDKCVWRIQTIRAWFLKGDGLICQDCAKKLKVKLDNLVRNKSFKALLERYKLK